MPWSRSRDWECVGLLGAIFFMTSALILLLIVFVVAMSLLATDHEGH